MTPKLIKTEADHAAALSRLEEIFEAELGTPEGDEAELLTALIELYEEKNFPIDRPVPLEAIRFRMEQQGLKPKDIVPYIGSASKVSEVLSGRRRLSLNMIRNLSEGLAIPAGVLLGNAEAKIDPDHPALQGRRFPIAEMLKRGWFAGFSGTLSEAREQLDELLMRFAAPLGSDALSPALNRQHVRCNGTTDSYALAAWRVRIAGLAVHETLPAYRSGIIDRAFVAELVRLSYFDTGPMLAKELLQKHGVHLVVERHLPKTHLDGAALRLPDGSPVVALTLRYDRLDHFWFTLCHELAHVALHLDRPDVEAIFDDLAHCGAARIEKEADAFAAEALIDSKRWRASKLSEQPTHEGVVALAEALRISPAIPAGRVRFETKDYTLFGDLLGNGRVRCLFEGRTA
jgi:HTH-type transcriptional regulator/antitoxin HigA